MAEVGDTIRWGYEGDPRQEEYRVGYGYDLVRIIEGESEEEWLERQYNQRLLPLIEKLDADLRAGRINQEAHDWLLQQAECELHGEAGTRFGDVPGELDDYSRHYPYG